MMDFLRALRVGARRVGPLEWALVVMNIFLVSEVWHEFENYSNVRSLNIEHFLDQDRHVEGLLSLCIIPHYHFLPPGMPDL